MKPNATDLLTLEEISLLTQMFENPVLMSGLRKIMAFEQREREERVRQQATLDNPNTNLMIQHAIRGACAKEWEETVRHVRDRLSVR